MIKPKLLSIAIALMTIFALPAMAGTTANTSVTGTYSGSLETKTFVENTDGKTSSSTDYDIQLLFNGNVFIYQAKDAKCMGNYTIEGDVITFTVNSVKGDAEKVEKIFKNSYKYSKSNGDLMLISNNNGENVYIYKLYASVD